MDQEAKLLEEEFKSVLKDAQELDIKIEPFPSINIISEMRRIKRKGKQIRFTRFSGEEIQIRTVFDHILSIKNITTYLLRNNLMTVEDYHFFSICIVYHDMCEVLIGDFPNHSSFFQADYPLNNVQMIDSRIRERIVNDFIWLYAGYEQKKSFEAFKSGSILNDYKLFKLIDSIDPIINIWRYIYVYNGFIRRNATQFIKIMDDFFNNPFLSIIISQKTIPFLSDVVALLRQQDKALIYCETLDFGKTFPEIGNEMINQLKDIIEMSPLLSGE